MTIPLFCGNLLGLCSYLITFLPSIIQIIVTSYVTLISLKKILADVTQSYGNIHFAETLMRKHFGCRIL